MMDIRTIFNANYKGHNIIIAKHIDKKEFELMYPELFPKNISVCQFEKTFNQALKDKRIANFLNIYNYYCGYVSVENPKIQTVTIPEVHPAINRAALYGITWAGRLPENIRTNDNFYYGFDTAHYGKHRTFDEVKNSCLEIANILNRMGDLYVSAF